MNGSSDAARADELLGEVVFLRRLARRLVRDPSDADDVEQDALLLAWERQPGTARAIRPWLAAVARRVAAHRRRASRRRESRESAAAVPASAPDPRAAVEHLDLVRAVVEELRRLAEPYRETLIRVYLDQETPHAIAARLALPAATVRSRLKRGIDLLRARLDARDPERPGRWRAEALAWLPWLARAPRASRWSLLAAAAALLVGVGLVATLVAGGRAPNLAEPRLAERGPLERNDATPSPVAAARTPDSAPVNAARESERAPEWLYGRLLGIDPGHPWRAPVVAHLDDSLVPRVVAKVATDGTFTLDLAGLHAADASLLSCTVVADDPDYVAVSEAVLLDDGRGFGPSPGSCGERVLRVTLAAAASGRVVDEAGRPLEGLDVIATRLDAGAISWEEMPGETFTDADGRFRVRSEFGGAHVISIDSAPISRSGSATARRGRLRIAERRELAFGRTEDLGTLVSECGATIVGRVVRSDGSVVEHARVDARVVGEAGPQEPPCAVAATDRDGAFELGGLPSGRVVVAVGAIDGAPLPDECDAAVEWLAGAAGPPARLVVRSTRLRLAIAPPSDEGVDDPATGAWIWMGSLDMRHFAPVAVAPGEFVAELAPDTTCELDIRAAGCELVQRTFRVAAGVHEQVEPVALVRAHDLGALRLQLKGARGERVARTCVRLRPRGGAGPVWTEERVVAEDGVAEFADIAAGAWTVEVLPGADANGLHGLFLPETGDVVLRAGATAELALPLRVGARLTLRIDEGQATARLERDDGSEIAIAWYAASGPSLVLPVAGPRADLDVCTDRALAPGRYRIVLERPGVRSEERWIDLASGESRLERFEHLERR